MDIKQSLESNKEEILKNLPKEFHADFEKSLNETQELKPMSESEIKTEVINSLPEDLKKDGEDIASEINPVNMAASKEEEKEAILASLPDDLKPEFEKNWKG